MISSQSEPAIDGENLSGDEMGRSSEKQSSRCDFFSSTVPPHGSLFRHFLEKWSGRLFSQVDHPRRDAVYRNLRSQCLGHNLRQHMKSRFGTAVVRVRGPRAQASQRTQVYDSAFALAQVLGCFTGDEKRAARIGSENCIPPAKSEFLKVYCLVVRSIVHQNIDAAQCPHNVFNGFSDLVFIRNIAAQSHSTYV